MTKMLKGFYSFVVAAAVLCVAVGVEAQRKSMRLGIGEQRTLSATNVKSYSDDGSGVFKISLTRDQSRFVIVGKRKGSGSLLLLMKDGSNVQYRIEVFDPKDRSVLSGVQKEKNVRLDLYFVQFSDNYDHTLGIDWPVSLPPIDDTSASFAFDKDLNLTSADFGMTLGRILPRLDIAQNAGWARIYRQAAVITENGKEAQFYSGGDFNVQLIGANTARVQAIQFGTRFTCTPRYDAKTGRIELAIQAEVSDLSPGQGAIPGVLRSEVKSTVNIAMGESVVLGGLIGRSESSSQGGWAGLSQIPVLGLLFGTNKNTTREEEALVFIVPSVLEPVPVTERNRIQEAMRLYERFSGGVDEVELLEQPRLIEAQELREGTKK